MDLSILLIDDDDADRSLFKKYLIKPGQNLTIVEASTFKDGLEIIRNGRHFDCVFLDYMLPDMDGISLLKKVYNKEADIGPFPVVMLKGQSRESVAIDAIRYGAQDYLIKDNISTDTLYIALAKAQQVFELKRSRNEARALLEHSQKMDAVGKLTGGIAHDFNNLLTITFGNTRLLMDMLQKETPDMAACVEKVRIIQKAMQRGSDLVKHLMVFSRQRTLEPVTVDLNQLMADSSVLLQRTLGASVEIKTIWGADIHAVDLDPGQLENVIINMGVNARDAMLDGGTLIFETENTMLDEMVAKSLGVEAGAYVKLTVSDTGSGMKEDVVEKIFDPFFTTKDIGKGTGLGLSTVYGFVKESGGAIEVESEKGKGTTFSLYFPQSTEETPSQETEKKPCEEQNNGGCETILVVEDEEEIRFLTTAMLRNEGYKILEASNGQEAVSVIQQSTESVDLLFTDIAMPGEMNGVQAAARVQALKPNIKLLFTTGYAMGSVPDIELTEEYPVLNKPYQPEDLMLKIRQVLDGPI